MALEIRKSVEDCDSFGDIFHLFELFSPIVLSIFLVTLSIQLLDIFYFISIFNQLFFSVDFFNLLNFQVLLFLELSYLCHFFVDVSYLSG